MVEYEDIHKSRQWLETAVRDAATEKQKARAKLILKAFEYYEASVISYLGLRKDDYLPDKDKKYYIEMHNKRYELIDEFEEDDILVHPLRFDNPRFAELDFDDTPIKPPTNFTMRRKSHSN